MLLATAFTDLETWRRSRKGNLWRTHNHRGRVLTLTVFARPDERFGWCIADESGPTFSRKAFTTEQRAIDDLADRLDI